MRWCLSLVSCLGYVTASFADVDFSREVLPILSENCFHCHGPDEKARKSDLRLDTQTGAFAKRDGYALIAPGKPAESEIIARILSKDEFEQMPPPDSNRKLTKKQIETLKQWVQEGAKWGQHWAYVPLPEKVAVPTVPGKTANPIDAFVLAKLKQVGLEPTTQASKNVWLRRVTIDLTGLPPTQEELSAFGKDDSPQAYEKVIDRLFRSPRYGERMAAIWLDLARYADTHGYQSDKPRAMWPYRDWVIESFNRNQKFDEFLTWQLAGDLLPNATQEQRLATAFNRLHMQNEEGGIVAEEFRVAYVVDRVNTMGTAFLGQTFECSRCHDHKYDPIRQKDYYQLFAFFQNIDEWGQTSYFTRAMPVPALLMTKPDQEKVIVELEKEVETAKRHWLDSQTTAAAEASFQAWRKANSGVPKLTSAIGRFNFEDWPGNKLPNIANDKSPGSAQDNPKKTPGKIGQGATLSGEDGFTFPGLGHFRRADDFTLSLWLKVPAELENAVIVHHSKAPVDAGNRGYEITLDDNRLSFGLHHMWPGNSLKVSTKEAIAKNEWLHLTATYDGSSTAAGTKIYLNGQLAKVEVVRDKLKKDIHYDGGGEPNLTIGNRFRDNGFKGGSVDEFAVFDRALSAIEIAILAGAEPELSEHNLRDYYFSAVHEATLTAYRQLHEVRKKLHDTVNPIPEVMVMEELPKPKPAYILKRGAYDSLGEPVTATTPQMLPAMPANLPNNRLGLAQWMTMPSHPLTARVTVNRLWQQMFGQGIVSTSDNFGTTGTPPTHPALLDWLARDFIDNGWDLQRTLKLMALSLTYRQRSQTTEETLAKDPYNDYLARMPNRRLSAEMLRDQALSLSGLLVEKRGGPSVYPYQPEGLWNEAMGRPNYPQSQGEGLYRRSLYTFWKRTAPHPQMTTFDAADRSVCTAKRQATSTPLQALALLNDPQIVEAARFLGERMLSEGGTNRTEQLSWLVQHVLQREILKDEQQILEQLWQEQADSFTANDKEAQAVLKVGEKRNTIKKSDAELATATIVALTLLNHAGAVNR